MRIVQFWIVKVDNFNNHFGDMDLFLLDYLLKGGIDRKSQILDAGCGSGRNLLYFLNEKFRVSAVDSNEADVRVTNLLSRSLGCGEVCQKADLKSLPFDEGVFDFIICARVLHFAQSEDQFTSMSMELSRVMKPSGTLYLCMASSIGMEQKVTRIDQDHHAFPDGSIRFLLNEQKLSELEKFWGISEKPRTVIYDGAHAETTVILHKL